MLGLLKLVLVALGGSCFCFCGGGGPAFSVDAIINPPPISLDHLKGMVLLDRPRRVLDMLTLEAWGGSFV
jgi:hypothetical protein